MKPAQLSGAPPRVLIINHDVVGQRMAGPGIRAWEIAQRLAQHQPVMLVAPQPIDLDAPFTCGSYAWGDAASLAVWLQQADVVVANGFVLLPHPELAAIPQPLALDLYDPVLFENLEVFRSRQPEERRQQAQQDTTLLNRQLAAGDFFICATERQRDLYLGALMGAGRITPAATDRHRTLRSLIDVVPFGLPLEPPARQRPALRGVVPGIGADDQVVLWTGGMWDWLDPQTLVRALPDIVAENPSIRVVFLAGKHPGNVQAMQVPAETRALADRLGLLGHHVFFYDAWIPYAERADFLLEADVAISLHHDHLETRYAAVRSRFLDHLWAGLPSVVTDGDAAAALVRERELGAVVADGDASGVAAALRALLGDDAYRRRCAVHSRALAAEYTWAHTLEPLVSFCRRPSMTREQPDQSAAAAPAAPEGSAPRDQAIARLEALWQVQPQPLTSNVPGIGQLKQSANALTRWYVQAIVEQQNQFNAATVQAMHQVAESIDRRHSAALAELSDLTQTLQFLAGQGAKLQAGLDQLNSRLQEIDTRLHDIDSVQLALARELATPARTED